MALNNEQTFNRDVAAETLYSNWIDDTPQQTHEQKPKIPELTPQYIMPTHKEGILIAGGRRHVLKHGTTVGIAHNNSNSQANATISPFVQEEGTFGPIILLPDFAMYGECVSPQHGRFLKERAGWRYYNLGQRGSRILRNGEWIVVDEKGVLLEDNDQIELGNAANDAEGVFAHLFFELQ